MKSTRGQIFLFLLIFFSTPLNFPQDLQFSSEKICIDVKGDYCIVTGYYWFINHSNKEITQNLYYPFLIHKLLPYPYKYEVRNSRYKECLPVIANENGIMFNIEADAKDTILYVVKFWQNTPSYEMEYILTTTKEWREPLVSSEYTVIVPEQYTLIKMVPEYERIIEREGTKTYSIIKDKYLPEENFKIIWRGNDYEKTCE